MPMTTNTQIFHPLIVRFMPLYANNKAVQKKKFFFFVSGLIFCENKDKSGDDDSEYADVTRKMNYIL